MTRRNIELSRRKILAGLGTAGVAAAGAGLGTTAWLNDTESFDGNVVEAGELDLILDYYGQYNNYGVVQSDGTDDTDGDTSGTFQVIDDTRNGGTGPIVTLEDVKPGDCGFLVLCPRLVDNPGHLWLRAQQTSDQENEYEEPEPETGDDEQDPGDPDGRGELDDKMLASVSYHDGGIPAEPVGDVCGYGEGGESIAPIEGPPDTAAQVLQTLSGGVKLDGNPGEGSAEPWPSDGSETDAPCIIFSFQVPQTVGNVIQGDSFGFDIEFYAEQARHNEGADNPFTGPVTLYAPDANERGFATTTDRANSGSGAWQSSGSDKETLYLGPDFAPFNTLPSFTVGEIEEISYHTWKQDGTSGSEPENFYVEIYTEPQNTTTVDNSAGTDDGSWYNKRLNAEPYFSEDVPAPGGQWNKWSTADNNSSYELWFFDANRPDLGYGWYGSHPSFDDITSGPIDWSNYDDQETQTVNYSTQEVKTIAISTGSGWTGDFEGHLDDITVTLTSGETLNVDLEQ